MENTFFFDFISPYAYLAWKKLKEKHLLDKLQLKPVVLGKIFSSLSQTPITQNIPKRDYLYQRAKIFAEKNNIPLNLPLRHPFNSLYLLRISLTSIEKSEKSTLDLIDALWDLVWRDSQDVEDPDLLVEKIAQLGFTNSHELMEGSFQREIKNCLKKNTVSALDYKVFGVPSFIVNERLFWGLDTLADFEDQL